MRHRVLFVAAILALVVCCKKSDDGQLIYNGETHFDAPASLTLTKAEMGALSEMNSFGFNLFEKLYDGSDMLISPMSISQALAMSATGAAGTTASQMAATLGFKGLSPKEVDEIYFKLLNGLLQCDSLVDFRVANSMWVCKDIKIKQQYVDACAYYFNSEVFSVDFCAPATLQQMNDWGNKHTNGMIPKMLDSIDPSTLLALANALYFKGSWKYEFGEPFSGTFHGLKGDAAMKFFAIRRNMPYYEGDAYEMVALPYSNGSFKMAVVLPAKGVAVKDAMCALGKSWGKLISGSENDFGLKDDKMQTNYMMPEFTFEYSEHIAGALKSMGMVDAFVPGSADFSGICDYGLSITDILHKTAIKNTYKGTEAAAVTVMVKETSAMPTMSREFFVDRPFGYLIYEQTTGAIIFMGTYSL